MDIREAIGRVLKDAILTGRVAMEWEKPEFAEISLACEVSSYANAELDNAPDEERSDDRCTSK